MNNEKVWYLDLIQKALKGQIKYLVERGCEGNHDIINIEFLVDDMMNIDGIEYKPSMIAYFEGEEVDGLYICDRYTGKIADIYADTFDGHGFQIQARSIQSTMSDRDASIFTGILDLIDSRVNCLKQKSTDLNI